MSRLTHHTHSQPIEDVRFGCAVQRTKWLPMAVIVAVIVVASSMGSAAVLTVGDHGTYSEIHDAVVAALGAGSTEIRVEQGTYVEHVYVTSSYVSDQIEITGGWDAAFATRSTDASLTVIDGSAVANQVIGITMAGGSLLVDGFTITNGVAPGGAGIRAEPTGGWITVSNNRIIGNTASWSGAGVYIRQESGNSRFSLTDNLISGNTVENTAGGSASGGGLVISASDDAAFEAKGNRIIDNTCIAPASTVFGCGVYIGINSSEPSSFSDNLIKGNRTMTAAGTEVFGAGGDIGSGSHGSEVLFMRRNIWIDNRDLGSQEGYHVRAIFQQSHPLVFSDSVIAGGPMIGLGVWSSNVSPVRLTNLTVFDHEGTGVYINTAASLTSLYNTIVYDSPTLTDVPGTVATGGNLLGVDPLFVNPINWDCHLREGSPALDSGENSPPWGLGQLDADGNPRVVNGVVDIGAYEGVATLLEDGFESGTTSAWSMVVP